MNSDFFHNLVVASIEPMAAIIELFALLILLITVLHALYQLVVLDRLDFSKSLERVGMESGLSVALEFLMVAEILKTISAVSLMKIVEVALLCAVRVFLTLVIHYERSVKERRLEGKSEKADGEKNAPMERIEEER